MAKEQKQQQVAIPDYVVLTQDREDFKERFKAQWNFVLKAHEKLATIRDLEEVIPSTLEDIKSEPVKAFIDERIAEINSTKMLTIDAKERVKKEWEDIRETSLPLIGKIKYFFEKYPLAKVESVNGKLSVVNIEELLFETCKRKTPKEDVMQHLELIQNVRNAIDALWAFENKHDYPSNTYVTVQFALESLNDPEQLARNWVHQAKLREYIEKHPYLKDAVHTGKRKSLAEQNAQLSEARKRYFEEHPDEFVEFAKQNPYEGMNEDVDNTGYDLGTSEMK